MAGRKPRVADLVVMLPPPRHRQKTLLQRAAAIDIVEPDDVVLAEIGARLHLDQKGRRLTRIGKAMLLADGDIGGLILAQDLDRLAARYLQRSAHHHPMFGPVTVAL